MGQIDFDAQRAEAGVEEHSITVGGREVKLVAVLSLRFGEAGAEGDLAGAVEAIVADPDDVEHVLDHLGLDELDQLAEELYGLTGDDETPAPNREARRARAKPAASSSSRTGKAKAKTSRR